MAETSLLIHIPFLFVVSNFATPLRASYFSGLLFFLQKGSNKKILPGKE
jgi:hypothetical protein